MCSVSLPLYEPIIRCFQHDAYPLSIIAKNNDYLPWFFSNYIQLCCHKDMIKENQLFLEFFEFRQAFNSPFLKTQRLIWESFSKVQIDICEFIVDCLDQGYYFFSYVDEYFIPERSRYHKEHFYHDILINGYDLDNKSFSLAGYNQSYFYSNSKVKFDEFESSFRNNNRDKKEFWWENDIYLLKYNEDALYSFDIVHVAEQLSDYLLSKNSFERYRRYKNPIDSKIFGLDTYNHLKLYFHMLMEKKLSCDLRTLYLLHEHKKCMILRIEYMGNNNYLRDSEMLYDSFKEIEAKVQIALNLLIKYRMVNDNGLINRIIRLVDDIAIKEKELIEKMLDKIQK